MSRGRARHRKKALSRLFVSRYYSRPVRVWIGWSHGDGRSAQREAYAQIKGHRIAADRQFAALYKEVKADWRIVRNRRDGVLAYGDVVRSTIGVR